MVSERWVDYMANRPASRVCVPTGETPRPVYTRSAPNIDLSEATVFLLDEFDLPPGSPARCDSMIQRDLLVSLRGAPRTFHRLDVDTGDACVECARFDALVADGGIGPHPARSWQQRAPWSERTRQRARCPNTCGHAGACDDASSFSIRPRALAVYCR